MSRVLLTLAFFLVSINSFSSSIKLFTVKKSIIIDRPIKEVFLYAGNTKNDVYWRSEVHNIYSDGEFEGGSRYIEDARLGIHPHYITEVELMTLNPPSEATYITVDENPFYLKSYRLFQKLSESKTRFTYKVDIEVGMINDIVGIPMPVTVIKPIYEARMKKYLKKLKRLLK